MIMIRETDETKVELSWGKAVWIKTGIQMFDHLLSQMARCWEVGLHIEAKGDIEHHVIEDVAICLGQEILRLDRKERFGSAIIPMDDALAMVVIDFGNRGYSNIQMPDSDAYVFLEALAREGRFNLHAIAFYGNNEHHIIESIFKALGRALKECK